MYSGSSRTTSNSEAESGTILYLYDQGCRTGPTTYNCTTACTDPEQVWSAENWQYTLANCMVYPLIASAWGKGILHYNDSHYDYATRNVTYNDTAAQTAAKYGILADADLDLSSPEPCSTINACLTAYCNATSNDGNNCSVGGTTGYTAKWHVGDYRPALRFNTSLCEDLNASINQDLGGVGMIIAYLIQISILLAGWVLESFNSAGTAVLVWLSLRVRRRIRRTHRSSIKKAKRIQHKIRHSRQAVALKVALVEFQKTQTFFVLAVAVAALLAVNNAAYLQVSSWQQFWNNITFISTISLSGCYPIVLNLLVLRKTAAAAKYASSLYLLGISAACVAVSMALWIYTFARRPSADQIVLSGGYYLPECGTSGVTNPTWTCLQDEGRYYDGSYVEGFTADVRILVFPLVILGFLVGEEVRVFRRADGGDETKEEEGEDKEEEEEEKKVNVFEYFRSLIDADWRAFGQRIVLAYQATSAWCWKRVPTKTKYQLDDTGAKLTRWHRSASWATQDGMAVSLRWYRSATGNLQDGLGRFAKRFPRTTGFCLMISNRFVIPTYIRLRATALHTNTHLRKAGSRGILLGILNTLYKMIPFITEIGLVTINIVLLSQYASYLKLLGDNSWSLGQVISVTIWVPVVVEYGYLMVWGIEEG